MGAIRRAAFSASLFVSSGVAGIWWMYFKASVKPLVEEHAGVFYDQWLLLEWAFPTTCLILMFISGLYLVFGGVQEEKATTTRRI